MAEDSSEIVKEMSESVAATNLKSLGDAPAFYHNMLMANTVNQQGLNQSLAATLAAKSAESVIATSPAEGAVDTAISQILTKMAQTTPPTTGV